MNQKIISLFGGEETQGRASPETRAFIFKEAFQLRQIIAALVFEKGACFELNQLPDRTWEIVVKAEAAEFVEQKKIILPRRPF